MNILDVRRLCRRWASTDGEAVKKWYVATLHLEPTYRGPYPAGDVSRMNFTFAPLGEPEGAGRAYQGPVDRCSGTGGDRPQSVLRKIAGAVPFKYTDPFLERR